jgi:hypothetical protein
VPLLAFLCQEITFGTPLERRLELAEEAIAAAYSSGDDAIIVRVLNHVSDPLQVSQLLEQSLVRSEDALARAERVGDPWLLFWAAIFRDVSAAYTGDADEMDRCIEIMRSTAEKLDQPTLNWWHAIDRASRALIAGETDEAELLAKEALRIGTEGGEPDAALFFRVQLISVHWQRGTLGELVPMIKQEVTENPGFPTLVAMLTMALADDGSIHDARHLLEEFAIEGYQLPIDQVWLTNMTSYAEAAIECRDPEYAGPLFDRLAQCADQISTTGATTGGPVSHYLGGLATVLGRHDEAATYFAQSAALSERVRGRFFAARTDLAWGRMLAERRARGDSERARDLLTKAHKVATTNGYGGIERRAARALLLLDEEGSFSC